MELVCPAGSNSALRVAIENGADAVYLGLQDETNARFFAGLNFSQPALSKAVSYVHRQKKRIFVAINTYASSQKWDKWINAVDLAANLGVDAVIIADLGLLDYAQNKHPDLNIHLSVQGSATNPDALALYRSQFNIQRAVLPRVLSLKQIEQVAKSAVVDLEVFGFGSLCIMAEGRCHLSSYVTGESPNMSGVCSPAKDVQWKTSGKFLTTHLNDVMIDRYSNEEKAGYPTLCKGRFKVNNRLAHALEEPTSLNTLDLIPALVSMGIKAIKIEGRQRSPAYVAKVTQIWRKALDQYFSSPVNFSVDRQWQQDLTNQSEGKQTTLGAYSRPWQ